MGPHRLRGDVVQGRHLLDGRRHRSGVDRTALERSGEDARPEGLGRKQQVSRTGTRVRNDPARVNGSAHRHSVLRLGVFDRVAADHRYAGRPRDRSTPLEDPRQDRRVEVVDREGADVERRDRHPAHRIDVAQRVGRRDPAEVVRIVDDGREEVDGLDQGQIVREPVDTRIVARADADENVRIRRWRQVAQDLRQVGGADFTCSTRAGRKLRQPDDRPMLRGIGGSHAGVI